jgi:DNA-binding transcriptional ArsR family regulator
MAKKTKNADNHKELMSFIGDKKDIDDTLKILALLANPTRFKMAYLLSNEELCNKDIEKILNVEQTLVSHYLKDFKELNLANERRVGKWRYYSIKDTRIQDIFNAINITKTGKTA